MTTTSEAQGTVLISGASIAGPALAYWLRRYGFKPTVVEKTPTLREGGYAVDFRGAAHLTLLQRMGLLDEVRRMATHMGQEVYVDANNKRLAAMPAEVFSGDVEILRGDLSRILYEATCYDTEYIFGNSIRSMEQAEGCVRVTFESGPARTFDLVVGADGLHSNVRTLAFGDESRYRHDLGYYAANFTTENFLRLDYEGRLYSTPGKMAGMYSARQNTEAKAMFYFASEPLDYNHHDVQQQKQILAKTFAVEGWEIPRLLDSMWDAPDFYFDSMSQVRMDRWSNGRVVLLGDAAYCASQGGSGTGLAVVGAYILAGELNAADGDFATAFARYEELMRGYVAENQKQAESGRSFLVPDSQRSIWLRNLMFRMLPYTPWKGLIAKMASKAANAITLMDYQLRAV